MCVVSNITDYGQKHIWPNPMPINPSPWVPPPVTPISPGGPWTLPAPTIVQNPFSKEEVDAIKAFLALVKLAKEVDAATGQPDCPDPAKIAWLQLLEERLVAIEQRLDNLEN